MPKLDFDQLRDVDSLSSLVEFLRNQLDWPIEDYKTDDLTFEWSADSLHIAEHNAPVLSGGQIRQLRSMVPTQPWGIFLVEFNDDRVHSGLLREILRGLVTNRRHDAHLPSWQHENLLFLCATQDYNRITIAHFRGETVQSARLTTFGWQKENPYLRTLAEFNLPALIWPDNPLDSESWLKSWTAAFDKEPITRDFFKRFDKALLAIKADLETLQRFTSAEAYSRAQLLLERMIFLYFLQNRGWLNQHRNYLKAGFTLYRDSPDECTYYSEFLEKLFFTLATPPGTADAHRLEGIPFLNGGLFNDDEFPTASSKDRRIFPPLFVRNGTFSFVFDHLLEAFNFTVREDTPLDQDVAVDPEMLGKVFESIVLHAEAEAEYNAPDKRKATGSYYTPRIVVHFICREALRQYLTKEFPGTEWENKIRLLFELDSPSGFEVDELIRLRSLFQPPDGRQLLDVLNNIKTCDPAVGSGAFPVGLLHELVNLRRTAETIANGFVDPSRREGTNWVHRAKAEIVENCLYGVDIQQQAIEICRLRLWLSLIVDYDLGLDPFGAEPLQFRRAIQQISQLPNLETNFKRGDSLLDYISGVNIRVAPEKSKRYHDEFTRIHNLGKKLHREKKAGNKRDLRLEILRNRLELSERVVKDEIKEISEINSQLTLSIVSSTESESKKKQQVIQETNRLLEALKKIDADKKKLEQIKARPFDARFYPELRKLEGADFDSPFNFSWRLDFADIFQEGKGGFDVILGNPPFVTARNAEKRELYRERWKRVCTGKYLLICPFFDLSFGLLRFGGELGFIVSNAFAKREFGKPLIEVFFPTVDLQKIVDCSGLAFPGHGTPTCIIFGQNQKPASNSAVRIAATLPGGGDLHSPPEESLLWRDLESNNDNPGYTDEWITVADRPRKDMTKHPWNFDPTGSGSSHELMTNTIPLSEFTGSIGPSTITRSNEVFVQPLHLIRRLEIESSLIRIFMPGDSLRNYAHTIDEWAICPYDAGYRVIELGQFPKFNAFVRQFKEYLENVVVFGRLKKETDRVWYEYTDPYPEKNRRSMFLVSAFIATHTHVEVKPCNGVFPQSAPVIIFLSNNRDEDWYLLLSLLNSSTILLWLKQNCYNKGAGEEEHLDRFEFAGTILEKVPIPYSVASSFRGASTEITTLLQTLSKDCSNLGRQLTSLAMRKLFENPGEAYRDWNSSISGYVPPDKRLGGPFLTAADLKGNFAITCDIREKIRNEMIALQEEVDWLVYATYGLIKSDSSALGHNAEPEPLNREQRCFVLWQKAGQDLKAALALIPQDWSEERKKLWCARLNVINENEHVRRIEQPVYKRRWDEQWKVGNRWQCGQVAYNAELMDAFDWWLSEKAEWWLEKKQNGGPVSLLEWASAMWQDERVLGAWQGVRKILGLSVEKEAFLPYFSALIKEQTVPDNIPVAVPWDEITVPVPASAKRIRGKLNVPRERFHVNKDSKYTWAGII